MGIRGFMWLSGLSLLLQVPILHAVEDPLKAGAYQASVEQEQLRNQTKRLMADMNRMLEEFRGNPAATEELALTEATIKKLQGLSENDMVSVVAALKEASTAKSGDAAEKVLSANKTAKEIQSTLVRLADKLAMFQDEASIDLRLMGLIRRQIANQRQTKYLSDGTTQGEDVARGGQLAANEQKAIKDELDSLLQSLQKMSTDPASTGQTAFAAILNAATSGGITLSSDAAVNLTGSKDFPAANISQGKVIAGLQAMILALNSSKSMEERLRTAQAQMLTLATKQEVLARTTVKTSVELQLTIARRENEIADQRTILEAEVALLSSGTVPLLGQSQKTLDSLDSTLRKNRGYIDSPDKKLEVVTTQKDVAGNFRQIAEMLKKKADEVAAANGSGAGSSDAAQSAMADAAASISEAISNMDMAQDLLNRGGDASEANAQIENAQGNIDAAKSQMDGAGDSAPKSAGDSLDQSKAKLGEGGKEATQEKGGPGRAKANNDVGQAKELASKALSDLQKAMQDAEGNAGKMISNSQVTNPNSQPGEGTGSGAGWGGLFRHNSVTSAYSAQTQISEKDRQALATVTPEKGPTEYSAMADQYLKNLAEGAVPAQ